MVLSLVGHIDTLNLLINIILIHLLALHKRCLVCRKKFVEHSELQDKICKIITIKEFEAYCHGFDVQFRPSFS